MTRPSFFEGVVVAAIASTTATLLHAALPLLLPPTTSDKLIVAILGGGYLIYLLNRTAERAGRLTTVLIWLCLSTVLGLSELTGVTYLAAHLLMLWLVRALYFQPGPLSAAGDGLLMAMGCLLATGAYVWSQSLLAAVWTFFLIQALFIFVADRQQPNQGSSDAAEAARFETAYRSAEAALEQLSASQPRNPGAL
jgi:hypothetical protein